MNEPKRDDDSLAAELEAWIAGGELNWDSGRLPVQLVVELPFWLMMPESSLQVTVGDCTLPISIVNDGLEVQDGAYYSRTHRNALFLGTNRAVGDASLPPPGEALARWTRTLLFIETTALADGLKAIFERGRRYQSAAEYFRAFAAGHLAFVNTLVNAYRRVSADPFALEVSEWDVPAWFLGYDKKLVPLSIFTYASLDGLPELHDGLESTKARPYFAATADELVEALANDGVPGELELLDAWGLFYRGRHVDSIRALVTAIEVLLEAKLREQLQIHGYLPARAENRLSATRNSFAKRLELYCELSGRRVPGPCLSFVPYINGIRLAEELNATRDLRHKIVHEGHRLDHTLRGPMLRANETMSWLFDWLAGGGVEKRRAKHATYFGVVRGMQVLEFNIAAEGVTVIDPRPRKPTDPKAAEEWYRHLLMDNILERQFDSSLEASGGAKPDIEHFTRMAFAKMGFGSLPEAPPPPAVPLPYFDRYRIETPDGRTALVFLIDTSGEIEERIAEQIAAAVTARQGEGLKVDAALCIANDLNGIPWQLRSKESLPEKTVRIAEACGLSIIRTCDLIVLSRAAEQLGWKARDVYEEIARPGQRGHIPLHTQPVGDVVNFFTKYNAISVELNGAVPVSVGDILAYRLKGKWHIETVASMQQNHQPVMMADRERVSIPVSITRAEVMEGGGVFVLRDPIVSGAADSWPDKPRVFHIHESSVPSNGRIIATGCVPLDGSRASCPEEAKTVENLVSKMLGRDTPDASAPPAINKNNSVADSPPM